MTITFYSWDMPEREGAYVVTKRPPMRKPFDEVVEVGYDVLIGAYKIVMDPDRRKNL